MFVRIAFKAVFVKNTYGFRHASIDVSVRNAHIEAFESNATKYMSVRSVCLYASLQNRIKSCN